MFELLSTSTICILFALNVLTNGYNDSNYNLFSNVSSLDATRPSDWNVWTQKGIKSFRQWQEKSGPDKPFPWKAGQYFTIKEEAGKLDCCQVESLSQAHISTNQDDYTKVDYQWPKSNTGQDPASFQCQINAPAGVFIVDYIARGDLPPAIHPSAVAWHMWVTQYLKTYPQHQNVAGLSGLNRFWMDNVIQGETIQILYYIHVNDGPGIHVYLPGDIDHPDPDNTFWTLLGSPLGQTFIWLLIERKNAMDKKGITAIGTDSSCGVFSMWAEYGQS